MNWAPFGDLLEGGLVANPFQFTDTNQEAFRNLDLSLLWG